MAVTPLPHVATTGWERSTPAFWNSEGGRVGGKEGEGGREGGRERGREGGGWREGGVKNWLLYQTV